MKVITLHCPSCGGRYDGAIKARFVTCEYCGTQFALDDEEYKSFLSNEAEAQEEFDSTEYGQSSASMADYTRESCAYFLDEYGEDNFESSPKILRGLDIPGDEEVFLIHDDTFFNSGKNGFAITSRGMYCREMGDKKAHFVDWDDFKRRKEPQIDGSYIRSGSKSVAYFTDDSDRVGNLEDLFLALYYHAQKVL